MSAALLARVSMQTSTLKSVSDSFAYFTSRVQMKVSGPGAVISNESNKCCGVHVAAVKRKTQDQLIVFFPHAMLTTNHPKGLRFLLFIIATSQLA